MTDDQFLIVNEKNKITGHLSHADCQARPELIRRSVHIVIVNHKEELVLKKRPANDLDFPDFFDTSVNTYVKQWQSSTNTASLKLERDLGITDVPMRKIAKVLLPLAQYPEFASIFAVKTHGPFRFDGNRIAALQTFVPKELQDRLKKEKDFLLTPAARAVLEIYFKSQQNF